METQKKEVEMLLSLVEQLAKLGPQHAEKIAELRLLLKDALEVARERKAHETSLQQTAREIESSEASLDTRDFKQLLETKRNHILENQQYNWEDSMEVGQFDESVITATGGDDSEEEVVVQVNADDVAPNRNCPCSLKPVLELEDPVEDDQGIVYDRQSIESYIRSQARASQRNNVRCPLAGSTHTLSLDSLRTAQKVLRAQKRHRRRQANRTEAEFEDDTFDA